MHTSFSRQNHHLLLRQNIAQVIRSSCHRRRVGIAFVVMVGDYVSVAKGISRVYVPTATKRTLGIPPAIYVPLGECTLSKALMRRPSVVQQIAIAS
jgi:hypothetical protein